MAVGVIDLVNTALLRAGCDVITALDQANSRNARVADTIYDITRQELLRLHPWNFAVTRATLVADASTPDFGYGYQFPLPADCLRVLREEDERTVYKVEGQMILTDESEFYLIYIADIEDVGVMDVTFRTALILRLATQFADMIKLDDGLAARLNAEAERALRIAKQIDGQEQTADFLVSDVWTNGE